MKVLFDDHIINESKTGLFRYTENLKNRLQVNDGISLFLYSKNKPFINNGLYRIFFGFNKSLEKYKPDILHIQNFAPIQKTVPIVNTVHDLCFIEDPSSFSLKSKFAFKFFFKKSLEISDHIIAVSKTVKKHLMDYYQIPEDKISVIYEAADDYFRFEKNKSIIFTQLTKKFNISQPFFLVVGSETKRKNIQSIIEAHHTLITKKVNSQLIITGEFQANSPNCICLPHVSDGDLNLLYNGATALIMNSTCEGFGLPLVEAMKCKTPIICNDIPVFREVCGTASIYTQSISELQKAMEMLLKKSNYDKYSHASFAESYRFSWNITAKKTIEVYNKVLNEYSQISKTT